MSILGKIHCEELVINILWYNVSFYQRSDNTGRPSERPLGGLWKIVFETRKNDPFLEYMVNETMIPYLKIVTQPATLDRKSRIIEIRDVYVLAYRGDFNGVDNQPMTTYIELSPASMVQNGQTMFVKKWKITDPDAKEVAATTITEPTPTITKVDWIHLETKEVLKETRYTESIVLRIKIENPSGNAVNIIITKKDNTEFEQGKKELSFSEILNDDGTFELTLKIKEKWQDFKTGIDELLAKITHSGATKKSKPLQIIPPPKVLVNFRTGNGYRGNYGFDWLRMGDTGKPGDVWYKDIIGSNATGSFVQSNSEYAKLGKFFEMPQHPIKANDKYVVPVLALLPNKKAKLTLKVEVEDSDAKKIEYKYDTNYFKLNKTEVSHKTVGKKTLANDLIIECVKEFGSDQFIEVKADGKFAGKLKVLANDKAHRFKTDIIFVNVTTELTTAVKMTGISTGAKKEFTKYFNQLLAKANYTTVGLDLSKDTAFNTKYAPMGSLTDSKTDGFQDYLISALKKQHTTDYSKHYKIFFLDEKDGGLYGRSYGIPSAKRSIIVLRPGLTDSTLAHETFHALGLHHSFSDKGDFTFEKFKTDNIMDYSDIGPDLIPVISTWQWQWKIIQNNIDKE